MRKFSFPFVGVIIAFMAIQETSAQQIAQYSQYLFNHFLVNPAVAGSKECIDVKIGYRRQWMGFESAPTSSYVNVQARLGRKKAFMKDRHGVGAFVESDDTGPTSRTNIYLAYAYHVPLNQTTYLSMGLFAGIQQYRLDASNIFMLNSNDPILTGSSSSLIAPDITPGLWLYGEDYYAGLSVRQVLRNKIKKISPDARVTHHYALTAGKRFQAKEGIAYIPSALIKMAPFSTPSLDLNLVVDYQNQFSIGLGWRNTDAIMGMFKVNFLKYFSLGYSFDFTTSKLRFDSANTHEIMLGLISCPRSFSTHGLCPAYQ